MPRWENGIPKPCRSYFSAVEIRSNDVLTPKYEEKDAERWKTFKRFKKKKRIINEVTAIPWLVRQWDWNGLLLANVCIVLVSLCPSVSPFPLPFPPQNKQRPLYFLFFALFKYTQFSRPFAAPNMPCFPYFWNVKCATCWHCAWMINMSVYNYNRKPPNPTIPPWCWQKMVWMLYRFRVFFVFCSSFI